MYRIAVLVLITFALVAAPAAAQISETDLVQQLRTDLQADRQAVVAAGLGLTDAEAEAFWPVYRAYRADMAKVGDRLQKLIQDFAKVWDVATDEQAKSMVDAMLAIQRDQVKVQKKHVSKFRKVLPEVKVARLMQLENKYDAVVNYAMAAEIPLIE